MKIYLAVPFVEKDEAKKLGAKWDGEIKNGIFHIILKIKK